MVDSDQPDLPGGYLLWLLDVVEGRGVSAAALLDGLRLTREDLSRPGARVELDRVAALIGRAKELTGDPALAVEVGMRMRVVAHGFLGFAALTASSVGAALELAERFVATRTRAIALSTRVEDGRACIRLEERCPLGEVLEDVVVAVFTGLWHMGGEVTGRPLRGEVHFAFPESEPLARLRRIAPGPVRFACPAHQLVFDASLLELPLVAADPVASELAREQCERELQALADGRPEEIFVARVREALPRARGGLRSQTEVAELLNVSPRTLKRRLGEAGRSFSDLRDEVGLELAERLMRDPERSLERVAAELGYSDASNFARAYRRWTGRAPGHDRRR